MNKGDIFVFENSACTIRWIIFPIWTNDNCGRYDKFNHARRILSLHSLASAHLANKTFRIKHSPFHIKNKLFSTWLRRPRSTSTDSSSCVKARFCARLTVELSISVSVYLGINEKMHGLPTANLCRLPDGNFWDPNGIARIFARTRGTWSPIFSRRHFSRINIFDWRGNANRDLLELAVIITDNVVRFRVNQLSPHLVLVFAEGMWNGTSDLFICSLYTPVTRRYSVLRVTRVIPAETHVRIWRIRSISKRKTHLRNTYCRLRGHVVFAAASIRSSRDTTAAIQNQNSRELPSQDYSQSIVAVVHLDQYLPRWYLQSEYSETLVVQNIDRCDRQRM